MLCIDKIGVPSSASEEADSCEFYLRSVSICIFVEITVCQCDVIEVNIKKLEACSLLRSVEKIFGGAEIIAKALDNMG